MKYILLLSLFLANIVTASEMGDFVYDTKQTLWIRDTPQNLMLVKNVAESCITELSSSLPYLREISSEISFGFVQLNNRFGFQIRSVDSKLKDAKVLFLDLNQMRQLNIRNVFMYEPQSNIIFAPRIEMTKQWLCAQLVHEFWHLHEDVHLQTSGVDEVVGSSVWADEEVIAYEAQKQALDIFTSGAYTKKLLSVIDTYRIQRVSDLLHVVTAEELSSINAIFASGDSVGERALRGPSFVIHMALLIAKKEQLNPTAVFLEVNEALAMLD